MAKYRSYNTTIKVLYILGVLEESIAKLIPGSTKSSWKSNIVIEDIFGIDHKLSYHSLEEQKIFAKRENWNRISRNIFKLENTLQAIFKSIHDNNKNALDQECKRLIVNTIDETKGTLGLKRILNLFQITDKQYRSFKRSPRCMFLISV